MRKASVSVLVLLLAGAASWADVDLGIGAAGGFSMGGTGVSLASVGVSSQSVDSFVPARIDASVDAPFFRISAGFSTQLLRHTTSTQTVSGATSTILDQDTGTRGFVTLGLLARIPFAAGSVTLFPLLGCELDVNVFALDAAGKDMRPAMSPVQRSDANQFWLRAGFGADFPISPSAFIQPQVMVGLKVPSPGEQAIAANAKDAGFEVLQLFLEAEAGVSIGLRL